MAAKILARTLARVKAAAPPTVARLPRLPLLPTRPSADLCWGLEIAQASNVSVRLTTGAYDASQSIQWIYYDHIFSEKPVVDWFEIISENYMVDGGRPLKMLDQIFT